MRSPTAGMGWRRPRWLPVVVACVPVLAWAQPHPGEARPPLVLGDPAEHVLRCYEDWYRLGVIHGRTSPIVTVDAAGQVEGVEHRLDEGKPKQLAIECVIQALRFQAGEFQGEPAGGRIDVPIEFPSPPRIRSEAALRLQACHAADRPEAGKAAFIVLSIELDAAGAVTEQQLLLKPEPRFEELADCLRRGLSFEPARLAGVGVPSRLALPIRLDADGSQFTAYAPIRLVEYGLPEAPRLMPQASATLADRMPMPLGDPLRESIRCHREWMGKGAHGVTIHASVRVSESGSSTGIDIPEETPGLLAQVARCVALGLGYTPALQGGVPVAGRMPLVLSLPVPPMRRQLNANFMGLCYPPDALRRHLEMVLKLEVRIAEDGALLGRSLPAGAEGWEQAADCVLQRTEFSPAVIAGLPVSSTASINIAFMIAD